LQGDREVAADLEKLAHSIMGIEFDAVYDMCGYTLEHAESIYPIIQNHTKRLIFFSTAAVYPETDHFPLREDHETGPHPSFGEYGSNKASIEKFYHRKALSDNFQLTIFRPHYIFGVGDYFQRHEYLLSRLEHHNPVYVPGNGQAVIQLAWHEDVVRLFHDVPFTQRSQVETLNIGGDEMFNLNGLIRSFAATLGVEPLIKHVRYEDHGFNERRFYDNFFIFPNLNLILDNTKAKQIYGYTPAPLKYVTARLVQDWENRRQTYQPNKGAEQAFGAKADGLS
jgi:dTDP-glucose 4,6-dehydratase